MKADEPTVSAKDLLLEREAECEAYARAFRRAANEKDGRLLITSGAMGVGKTRLLDEAAAIAATDDFTVLSATAGELDREFPFGVVLDLFEASATRCDAPARRRRFRGRAAAAKDLLAGNADLLGARAESADEFALFHGLYWFALNLSEERPLALIVDDVHWADELSLRFLVYLAQRIQGLPIVLVAGVRSGEPTAEEELVARMVEAAGEDVLCPERLGLEAVTAVLAANFGEPEVDRDLAQISLEVTGGNPFLLHSLLHSLEGEEIEWAAGEAEKLRSLAPREVRSALLHQVGRLGEDAVSVAQAAAVLGSSVRCEWVIETAGLDEDAAEAAVNLLSSAEVLGGEVELRFRHAMYRAAVYEALEPTVRARLHARSATVLHNAGRPDEHVAHHLLLGAAVSEPWAAETLHRAARIAAQRGAPAGAARLLKRAVNGAPPSPQRAEMLMDLGIVEAAAGEELSLRHFSQAVESFESDEAKAEALYALGQTLYRYGRFGEAAATLEQSFHMVSRSAVADASLLKYQSAYFCAASYLPDRFPDLAQPIAEAAAPLLERSSLNGPERALLTCLLMRRYLDGSPADETAALARRAIGDGDLMRFEGADGITLYAAIEGLHYCDCMDEATTVADVAVGDARDRGSLLALSEASQARAQIMFARGRLDEAMTDAQTAIDGIEFGYGHGGGVPHSILAECMIERGELELAREALDEAERRPSGACLGAWPLVARGRLLLAEGKAPEALEQFYTAGRLLAGYGVSAPALGSWRSFGATAAELAGRSEEARSLAEADLEVATRCGAAAWIGRALRSRARLEEGARQAKGLRQAIAVLEGSGARLELGWALLELGIAERRAGRRLKSRESLRQALDLGHSSGGFELERRAREELLASGGRPRRHALTGVAALTPGERRVAERAAGGMSNREIAEALFLTKNTVDWHLRNAYQKLGVHSRSELSTALETEASASPTTAASVVAGTVPATTV